MTEQSKKLTSNNNRVYIFSLLAVILLIGSWITYFIVNFDLNDYRKQAEDKLSSLLSLPVAIGEMEYDFHENRLALEVSGIQIGDESSQLEINAPALTVDLQWGGLLQREFKFSTITLTKPHIRIRKSVAELSTTQAGNEGLTPLLVDQALLYNLSIDELEISDGLLHIDAANSGQGSQTIEVNSIQGEAKNLQLHSDTTISFEGNLLFPGQKQATHVHIQGVTSVDVEEQRGFVPKYSLDIRSKNLDLNAIGTSIIKPENISSVSGNADINMLLQNTQAEQINFQLELNSKNLALVPNSSHTSPIEFSYLLASGQLGIEEGKYHLRNLSLQIDDSRLSGELNWTKGIEPFELAASLANSKFTVTQIKQWLPDLEGTWATIDKHLDDQGVALIQAAQLTYSPASPSNNPLQIQQLTGELQEISWTLYNAPKLTITTLPFSIREKEWKLSKSKLKVGSMEIGAHGQGSYDTGVLNVASLDFRGEALPQNMINEWYFPQSALLSDGKVDITGHLEGPHNKLAIDVQADLSHLSLKHPAGLTLSPGSDDHLAIHATITPERINLDHGSIKWSAAKGYINGSYLPGYPGSLELDAFLSIHDLNRIAESLPLLEKLDLRGQAELSILQRGHPETNRPEMILTLRDAGLKATRHIADLKNINGRIKVEPTGLQANGLSVQLGESFLTVDATLTDFTDPQLSLDVNGPSVRAQDIIFYSDSAVLRDIDGHLEIDRNGLSFSPVNVRLDGGTDASVNGTIGFTSPYPVNLDISSQYTLISEVIGLWAGQSKNKQRTGEQDLARTKKQSLQTPIMITAHVHEGDLYGMSFKNASGVIKPSRERLTIHPLDFSVGEGYFNAQVITEFQPESQHILRISGHAEDVDALEIYRELLNQKSIVRGKLRGDFYLHGEIGSSYLSTSYGRFNLQIRDGVLHQFPVLSKVFSLLNVSQIFALQLPDMDSKGMPFDILSANLRLDEGVVTSNDMAIKSEAMNQSYSGKLNLVNKEIDLRMAIHPLGTVDKIVSRIPIAGWLLTGEDKALLTAHFNVTGKTDSVSVQPMPLETISEPTIGLLRRTLGLPFKLIEDPQILWGGQSKSTPGQNE